MWLQVRGLCCFCHCVLNTDCSGQLALSQTCWRVWVGELFVQGSTGPLYCVTELSEGASEQENKGDRLIGATWGLGKLFGEVLPLRASMKISSHVKKREWSPVRANIGLKKRQTVGSLSGERLLVETCMKSVLCSMFRSESGKGRIICWRYQVI